MTCPICGEEMEVKKLSISNGQFEYNLCCEECAVGFWGYDKETFEKFVKSFKKESK